MDEDGSVVTVLLLRLSAHHVPGIKIPSGAFRFEVVPESDRGPVDLILMDYRH
jgi:hypothetical protein